MNNFTVLIRPAGWTLLLMILMSVGSPAQQQSSGQADANAARTATPLPVPTLVIPENVQPDLVSPAAPANYLIGANDLVSVFVYQVPEMTRQVRVDVNGSVRIPFASGKFQAAGRTALQLQQEIASDLLAEGLVRAPVVQVTVVQVESKPIVVGGAVQRPLVLQAARPMRLMEVLSSAGGLTTGAGTNVLVSHQGNGTDLPETHSYDLARLMRLNDPNDDPILSGNEMVTVLPAQMVYVVGDFKQPGAFPVGMGEPVTVLRAIALGKGLDASPNQGKAEIIRTGVDGARSEIPVAIDRIIHHKAPDIPLQAGDIFYVSKDAKRALMLAGLTDVGQLITLGTAYHFP